MATAVLEADKTAAFDVADVEYLRHGDKPLLARIYTPHGAGPFPAMYWWRSFSVRRSLWHQAPPWHSTMAGNGPAPCGV